MISSFAFGQESTSSQMLLYGKYLLNTGKVFDIDAKLSAVNALGIGEVNKLLSKLDFSLYSAAVVGKKADKIQL